MNIGHDQSTNGFGLLANGSSGPWNIAIDESLDGGEYTLEIDGPTVYLIFRLEDLAKPRQALRFLQSAPPLDRDPSDPDLPDSDEALHARNFRSCFRFFLLGQ